MSLYSLAFPPDLERVYERSWHKNWRLFDKRWTWLQLAIGLWYLSKSSWLSVDFILVAAPSLFRCIAWCLASYSRDYSMSRPLCMASVKLVRTVGYVACSYLLGLPSMTCTELNFVFMDIALVPCIIGLTSSMLFKQHVLVDLPCMAVKLAVVLRSGGLCDKIAVAMSAGQHSARCQKLQRNFNAASRICSLIATLFAPWSAECTGEPLQQCQSTVLRAGVILGFLLPTAVLYWLELSSRRAFLAARGQHIE